MRKQLGIETIRDPKKVTVLSVSPNDEDHATLSSIIVHHTKWELFTARDLSSCLAMMEQCSIAVLLCERNLRPGTWKDVLESVNTLQNAPALIVASRLADDHLWAEALNLGAWDVLAKPFDRVEVIRSVQAAWQRWHERVHMRATTGDYVSAAS